MARKSLRSFYCEQDLWKDCEAAANERGQSIDDLLNSALRAFLSGGVVEAPAAAAAEASEGASEDARADAVTGTAAVVEAAPEAPAAATVVGLPGLPGAGALPGLPAITGPPSAPTAPAAPADDAPAADDPPRTGGLPPLPAAPRITSSSQMVDGDERDPANRATLTHMPAITGPPSPPVAPPPPPPKEPADDEDATVLRVFYGGEWSPVTGDRFVIGRGTRGTDLTIRDANISRKHAAVIRHDGVFYIQDLGSTNGIEFEGNKVDTKRIEEGDRFIMCDHEVVFSFE